MFLPLIRKSVSYAEAERERPPGTVRHNRGKREENLTATVQRNDNQAEAIRRGTQGTKPYHL